MRKMKYVMAAFVLLFALQVYSWEDCPLDLVNDPYPGECGRYIDTNQDAICDLSQTRPTTTLLTTATIPDSISSSTTEPSEAQPPVQKPATGEYNFLSISFGLLIMYFLSSYLSKRGILFSAKTHRKIWNVLLFFTFFGAGITGILIVLRLDQRWEIPFIRDITFWHVETGLAMTIIAFFHCAWHWKYYLTIMRGKKEK
jgi:hypothetical protein